MFLLLLLFPLFFAFICWLFSKDVFKTLAAIVKKDRYTSKLTLWQMIYHIVLGAASGAFAVTFLVNLIMLFILPDEYTE